MGRCPWQSALMAMKGAINTEYLHMVICDISLMVLTCCQFVMQTSLAYAVSAVIVMMAVVKCYFQLLSERFAIQHPPHHDGRHA